MSSHNHPFEAYGAPVEKADPGTGNSIYIDRDPMVVNLVSGASAETRTLARPTRQGATCIVHFKTDGGGDITLTVTGGFNETGDATMTFANAGEFAVFVSLFDGGDYFWRLVSHHQIGNIVGTQVVPITGATTVTAAVHANKTILVTSNADIAITLPAMSGTGNKYRVAMGVDLSSKTVTIVATGKHLFGGAFMNTDTAAGTLFTAVAAANNGGATTVTLNGSTTGGRKGDWIEIEDAAPSIGLVRGMLNGSGTEATPFG